MAIIRINEFQAAIGQVDALHAFLADVIAVVGHAQGCQSCQLLRQHDDASKLLIIEHWDSIADHQAAAQRIPAEQIAKLMPLLAAPIKGAYYQA